MNRLLAAIAVLALAIGVPSAALAHHKKPKKPTPRAKVYRATIGPVGTDAAYAGIHGKAHLVDGKKNNKITIHMRGLKPGTTYPWHIHEFAAGVTDPCAQGAAQGPIVTAFNYRPLRANPAGNARSFGTSRRFTADRTKRYYVNVHDPTSGAPIACGVLKKKARKAPPRRGTSNKGSSKKGSAKGRSRRP